MKKVLMAGAFDYLHWGHIQALRKGKQIAKKINGILIVGVHTDRLYRDYKGVEAIHNFHHRVNSVKELKCVDRVVPQDTFNLLDTIKRYNVDVYALSDEWVHTKKEEFKYMKVKGKKIVIIPRFKETSSTKMKESL